MNQHPSKWQPNDWLRLVALVGGFCFFGLGVWLLVTGISADGIVDLKSSIISGTLKTGSAGLFVCFFSLVVIAFVLTSLVASKSRSQLPQSAPATRSRRMLPLFWGCLIGLLACGAAMLFVEKGGGILGFFMGIFGLGFTTTLAAIIRVINDGD